MKTRKNKHLLDNWYCETLKAIVTNYNTGCLKKFAIIRGIVHCCLAVYIVYFFLT